MKDTLLRHTEYISMRSRFSLEALLGTTGVQVHADVDEVKRKAVITVTMARLCSVPLNDTHSRPPARWCE